MLTSINRFTVWTIPIMPLQPPPSATVPPEGLIRGFLILYGKVEYVHTSSVCICSLVFSLVSRLTFSSSPCRSSMACCWGGDTRHLSLDCTCPWLSDLTHICLPYWCFGKIWFVYLLCQENVGNHLWFDVTDERFRSVIKQEDWTHEAAVSALCVIVFPTRFALYSRINP